jgi:hypothetical protein
MLPKVNSASRCAAKHQLHVLKGLCPHSVKPCFASFTEAYICVKFLYSLDLLVLLHQGKRTKKYIKCESFEKQNSSNMKFDIYASTYNSDQKSIPCDIAVKIKPGT